MSAIDSEKKEDYYAALGVEKNASQGQITTCYRKLALKYHPDRNRGPKQEEATEKFKAVSEAYACLGDVTRRRQYDLHGSGDNENKLASMEAVEVENVGWLGRFLAAQVAKLGVPIPTSVSAEVLGRAKELSSSSTKGGGGGSGGGGSGAKSLQNGVVHEGKLSLAKAEFFTLKVDSAMATHGVVLAARSRRKNDRFRVLVFDSSGDVKHQAESSAAGEAGGRVVARCRLFLTPYDTLTVGAPFPSLDDTPPVCHSLDTLEEKGPCALEEGTHLVCVYCDNFLSSIEFTLAAVPMEAGSDDGASERVANLQQSNERLKTKKQSLNALAEDIVGKREALIRAQEEYKEVVAKAETEGPVVAELLRKHAECQQVSVAVSLAKLQPTDNATLTTGGHGSGSGAAAAVAAAPAPSPSSTNDDGPGVGRAIGGFFRRLSHANPPSTHADNRGGGPAAAAAAPGATPPSPPVAPSQQETQGGSGHAKAEKDSEEAMPDAASL